MLGLVRHRDRQVRSTHPPMNRCGPDSNTVQREASFSVCVRPTASLFGLEDMARDSTVSYLQVNWIERWRRVPDIEAIEILVVQGTFTSAEPEAQLTPGAKVSLRWLVFAARIDLIILNENLDVLMPARLV